MTATLPPSRRRLRPVPAQGAAGPRGPGAGTVTAPAPADARARAGVGGPPPGGTGLRRRPGPPSARAPGQPGIRTRPPAAPARLRPGRGPGAPGALARPGAMGQESRTRFVFLVIGLLGGALISLLLINTVLATGSYEITTLQKANVQFAQQRQALQEQIASEQTPAVLYRRARQLGMVDPPLTHFLDLRKGRIISQPTRVPGVVVYPPGYTP